MPKFAANLSMLFNEVPFLERFAQASQAGFKGVEYLFPYDFEAHELAALLKQHDLEQVLFNMPPGNWEAGERGLASLPGREQEFENALVTSIEYANILGCKKIHMMAGIPLKGTSAQKAEETYIENLQLAARACQPHGITVLIEPINLRDMPGYFLHHQGQAVNLLARAGEPNTALQMDLYHCQISEGDLAKRLQDHFEHIGHFQVAGVPERHEPDCGEINYPYLFELIDSLGYSGWIGCEYRPAKDTQAGLVWAAAYAIGWDDCPPLKTIKK